MVISVDISPDNQSSELWANNMRVEFANGSPSGTITLISDNIKNTAFSKLLGHTFAQADNEMDYADSDTAPNVLIGTVEHDQVGGAKSYTAMIFKKVIFIEPSISLNTGTKQTTFNTTQIVGNYSVDATGKWLKRKTFTTQAAAKAWLEEELEYSAS
ncbi:hypothetical protein AGMMS49975_24730 [Clostridia bacterium]|nr:hypothetical protein AGMMS49975_24730 [Clostridia bacterium]